MKPSRSIAITGATSFTGLWIAREFSRQGWTVYAQCSKSIEEYTGVRRVRAERVREWTKLTEALPVERFSDWIRQTRPLIWIHHHHFMENFRSGDYDSGRASEVGLRPLPEIVETLHEVGCRGIVFSGSFFESGEGGEARSAPPTPYARSKKDVWDELSRISQIRGIPLSKVVIPNPIGPFENEDRLIPQMLLKIKRGETLQLSAPHAISDQLPAEDLAREYVSCAERLIDGEAEIRRPSGWVGEVGDWVDLTNRELIEKRLGQKACPVIKNTSGSAVASVFENPASERREIDWSHAWDHYAEWTSRYSIS